VTNITKEQPNSRTAGASLVARDYIEPGDLSVAMSYATFSPCRRQYFINSYESRRRNDVCGTQQCCQRTDSLTTRRPAGSGIYTRLSARSQRRSLTIAWRPVNDGGTQYMHDLSSERAGVLSDQQTRIASQINLSPRRYSCRNSNHVANRG